MRSTITSRSRRLSRARLVITVTYRDSVVAVVPVEANGQSRAWWRRTASRRGRSVAWPEDRGGDGLPRLTVAVTGQSRSIAPSAWG